MKALTLTFLLICFVISDTEAKGFRMRGGGYKYSSRPRMGMGMGMGLPLFIPVVIPMGGMGRHRTSYRYGLQCFSCEGMDNDMCVISPTTISRHVTCPYNQYCSVLRRELTFHTVANPSETNRNRNRTISSKITSSLNDGAKSNETVVISNESLDNPQANELKTNGTKSITRVMISRGCKSPEILQSNMMASVNEGNGAGSTKTYIQFCLNDFCNFGDGRLKCYDCEGTGSNHPCMLRPADVAEVVTCEPNEYCNILRMTSLNSTISVNGSETITTAVSVARGCRAAGSTDDDFDADDGTSLLSLSCSSDLCNFVDATYLTRVNAATTSRLELLNLLFAMFLSLIVSLR